MKMDFEWDQNKAALNLSKERKDYEEETDALYLELSNLQPDGVIEIAEGINIDTTSDGKLAGIEILKASKKLNINTILSYTLELDRDILSSTTTKHQSA